MNLTRRDFLAASAVSIGGLAVRAHAAPAAKPRKKLCLITNIYFENSHARHIADRFFYGYLLRGKHHLPDYELVSFYVDQLNGKDKYKDMSVDMARQFGVRHCKSIPEALAVGGDKLAVDGVLLIGEHGDYPVNAWAQDLYPRYELLEQIVNEFRRAGRVVPVFNDKHLSYNWKKAKQMVDWSRELSFPFQAGSSLPVTWRIPDLDLPLETPLESALVVGYGEPDRYGYHALETLQCHVERRPGGEKGLRSVQSLRGVDVWKAIDSGVIPQELVDAALGRSLTVGLAPLRESVPEPLAFLLEYRDGFKASVLMLNGYVEDFTYAARIKGKPDIVSTMHALPWRPAVRFFDGLVDNVEKMLARNKAVIPVERTLLVSGALESLLQSRYEQSRLIETPHLEVVYTAPSDPGHMRGPIDRIGQEQFWGKSRQ